jgi:deoxyribodipyrimidine photo-lyase
MKEEISIFIFRRDLRVQDNKALNKLLDLNSSVSLYPMFIFNPKQIYAKNNEYFSNNAIQFMIESLEDLEDNLPINYHEGDDIEILNKLHKKYHIKHVAFNKDYTPYAINRDKKILEWCESQDITIITDEDYTLFTMGSIKNGTGKPYQVFTPFYRQTLKMKSDIPITHDIKKSNIINDIKHFDKKKYYTHNANLAVRGGRKNALARLKMDMKGYHKNRDYPAADATTKLSAYIKFGCVSIREVFYNYKNNKALQRELIWREFYANILYHFPHVIGNSFKKKYDKIKWSNNKGWFKLWCEGKTGFALVDAGMRQLNETGWMHNRVRMIVAMFLTKDLLIDWRWGEKYFATRLVDYDPASNNGGWQWSASTGTDAQPYFRIFNPDLQIKKYDKNYEYIKQWNPNYKDITPIVDHKERSLVAIKIFKKL